MASEFEKQLLRDVKDIFLNEDFTQDATYTSVNNSALIPVKVQFFEEPLDKMETLYQHAWCASEDIPNVAVNDKLIVNGIEYGIVDFTHDEFHHGVDLFLQKV